HIFSKYMSQAYTWDLWGAAYVIGGGCGNDGFEDFRGWLISKGPAAYENAPKDPEALGSILHEDDGDGQIEGFGNVGMEGLEEKNGEVAGGDAGRYDLGAVRACRRKVVRGQRRTKRALSEALGKVRRLAPKWQNTCAAPQPTSSSQSSTRPLCAFVPFG